MKIGAVMMKGLMWGLSALPLGFHYACSGLMAWFLRDVMHYRRDVVTVNIARSFPDRKYRELKRISRGFYRHLGEILAETVWFGGCRNPERLRKKRLVEYSNIGVLEDAFAHSPGVVVLESHSGNWELTGGCLCYDYRPVEERKEMIGTEDVVVVYKPLRSKTWDEVMRVNRCAPVLRYGYEGYISSGEILRYALEHRDSKKVYVFPTDQCPYKGAFSDDTVTFMHQPTKTMLGGASLAHKFGYSVLFLSMMPESRGHYKCSFVPICDDAGSMTPHEIMQRYYDLLQADLEKCPENYLWSHKRWKR